MKESKKTGSSHSATRHTNHPEAKAVPVTELSTTEAVASAPIPGIIPNQDKEKKIKALRKKLRDIDELALRDPSSLNSEQIDKLSKRSLLEDELKSLEDRS